MNLTINTAIKQQVSEELNDQIILSNLLAGNDDTDAVFKVEDVDVKQLTFDETSGPAFTLDVLADLGITPDKMAFIHAFAFNTTSGATECPDPVKFNVAINDGTNTITLGAMAQFELADLSSFPATGEITFSNVATPAEKTSAMIIIIGSIK